MQDEIKLIKHQLKVINTYTCEHIQDDQIRNEFSNINIVQHTPMMYPNNTHKMCVYVCIIGVHHGSM